MANSMMKLWSCDKDGFNAEPVPGTDGITEKSVFSEIPYLYDGGVKIISISFNNPDGTAAIRVQTYTIEDGFQNAYYYIQ